jgi:hypothetical protein
VLTTTRLGLEYPQSSDNVSSYPTVAAQATGVLDNAIVLPTYTTFNTSGTAADGQLCQAAPGVTVTLPNIGSGQKIVQVVAISTVTGASPVTVAAGSGQTISTVGALAASSILLGTAGAFVTLYGSGTVWTVIAGQQDTGWVTITAATGWSAGTGTPATPQAKLVGNIVRLQGGFTWSGGGTVSPVSTLASSLPTGISPPAVTNRPVAGATPGGSGANAGFAHVSINTGGLVQFFNGGSIGTPGGAIYLDGLSYSTA